MDILITGKGAYRDAIADLLANDYDVTCLAEEDHPEYETIVTDPTNYAEVRAAFEGRDAVIDLPAAGGSNIGWEGHRRLIEATYNFIEAANESEIERYILGSTNRVVEGYEVDHTPQLYDPEYDFVIDHTVPARPQTLYAVARHFAESLGRCYVESDDWQVGRQIIEERSHPKRFYAMRWGSIRAWDGYDHPYGDAEYGVEHNMWDRGSEDYELAVKRMKCTWLSRRDLEQLLDLMLTDETVTFDIFYGVSDNNRRWLDISHAKDVLGYDPIDEAEEWNGPPA